MESNIVKKFLLRDFAGYTEMRLRFFSDLQKANIKWKSVLELIVKGKRVVFCVLYTIKRQYNIKEIR